MPTNLGIGGHQSHRMLKDEWLTPKHIIEALGPFDLDPCASEIRPWETAQNYYTREDDGLVQPWGECFIFCNPPYGKMSEAWLKKLKNHPRGGIALIFARTETSMFVSEVWNGADALLFLFGRLYFYNTAGERATSNSGAPSVLIGYGEEAVNRLIQCKLLGAFISTWVNKDNVCRH
jgi:hypothetical protein